MAKETREKLHTTIEEIPESKIGELLDFVELLLEKERRSREGKSALDPDKDPILGYIGGVSHGCLAKDIDSELYGEKA
jgi:hypothetical protein